MCFEDVAGGPTNYGVPVKLLLAEKEVGLVSSKNIGYCHLVVSRAEVDILIVHHGADSQRICGLTQAISASGELSLHPGAEACVDVPLHPVQG